MLQYTVYLGVLINVFGTSFYIRDVLRGDTKPNRATWLMWSIAPLIATAAALVAGVRLATLPVLATGLLPLVVFGASFVNPKAYWQLTRFDYICVLFSVLGLMLWAITKNPIIAIIFAILSDAFAAIPTVIKSWKYPETETAIAYATAALSVITSFFAVKNWAFAEYAFPLYLIIINSLIVLAIYRKKFLGGKTSNVRLPNETKPEEYPSK